MADHPLRPATRLSLGEPLPHQQADRTQAPLLAPGPVGVPSFNLISERNVVLSGISLAFAKLFRTERQITYALLTLLPLSALQLIVRLACLIHAASVRSEPGSNSPIEYLIRFKYSAIRVEKEQLRLAPCALRFAYRAQSIKLVSHDTKMDIKKAS